jgi:hypothetical protein
MFKRYNNHVGVITLPSGAVLRGVQRMVYDAAEGLTTIKVDDHPQSTTVHDWDVPAVPIVIDPSGVRVARPEYVAKNQSASKPSAHPTRHTPTK